MLKRFFVMMTLFLVLSPPSFAQTNMSVQSLYGKSFGGEMVRTVVSSRGNREITRYVTVSFLQGPLPYNVFMEFEYSSGKRYLWPGSTIIQNNTLTITSSSKKWVFVFKIPKTGGVLQLTHIETNRTCDWVKKGSFAPCSTAHYEDVSVLTMLPSANRLIPNEGMLKSSIFKGSWDAPTNDGEERGGSISITFSPDGKIGHFILVTRKTWKWKRPVKILPNGTLIFDKLSRRRPGVIKRRDILTIIRQPNGEIVMEGFYMRVPKNEYAYGGILKLKKIRG